MQESFFVNNHEKSKISAQFSLDGWPLKTDPDNKFKLTTCILLHHNIIYIANVSISFSHSNTNTNKTTTCFCQEKKYPLKRLLPLQKNLQFPQLLLTFSYTCDTAAGSTANEVPVENGLHQMCIRLCQQEPQNDGTATTLCPTLYMNCLNYY